MQYEKRQQWKDRAGQGRDVEERQERQGSNKARGERRGEEQHQNQNQNQRQEQISRPGGERRHMLKTLDLHNQTTLQTDHRHLQ